MKMFEPASRLDGRDSPADILNLKPSLDPEEFAEDYLKYTLYGNGGAQGRGFISPYNIGPFHRILHSKLAVNQYLENAAPRVRATYIEAEDGGRTFPYLVADDLAEALSREQPRSVEEVKFILRRLGYSTWLRRPEGETLVELFSVINAIPKGMRTFVEVKTHEK